MTDRILLSSNALLVSRPGKSASSTLDSDFLINANRLLTQPYVVGTLTTTANGTTNTTIAHNLGYIPVVILFGANDSNNYQVSAKITTANIVISYTRNVTYIIFRAQVV